VGQGAGQPRRDVAVYRRTTAGGTHAMARHFDVHSRGVGPHRRPGPSASVSTPDHAWPRARSSSTPSNEYCAAFTGRIDWCLQRTRDEQQVGRGPDANVRVTGQIDPRVLVASSVKGGPSRRACDSENRRRGRLTGRYRVPREGGRLKHEWVTNALPNRAHLLGCAAGIR